MTRDFSISGKAKSTLTNYLRCLSHLALHYKCSPEQLDEESINDYLFYCQNLHKTPSESFFKHTIYGLRASYKVMKMPSRKLLLPQIKHQKSLPVVLNKTEVIQLLNAPKYLRHKLILAMLYGCGLRSYELCNLKLSDVDFERNQLFVKKQKGKRDRYVPLDEMLLRGLKKYIASDHPEEWLFNSQITKEGKLQGITTRAIQWVIKENRSKVATNKKITAHTLRHTYATHLLEEGVNILVLKELLGHVRIETTLVYLHVANRGSSKKFSPLSTLYKKD